MANDNIKTPEEKLEIMTIRSIENTIDVDLEVEVDQDKLKMIRANKDNPILIAKLLLEDSPTIIRTGAESNTLYQYNGRCFDILSDSSLDKMVLDFLTKYGITKSWNKLNYILRALRVHDSVLAVRELNPFKDLINLKNGVLNVRTKEFSEHSSKYFFDHYIDVEYDKDAKDCPVFIGFLQSVFSNDKPSIENAIRLGGYLLDSSTRAEKFFLMDGDGGSGKSTLLDSYSMFFPERYLRPLVTSIPLETLSRPGFEKTDLIHSRFNQCAETKKGHYDAEFLKKMVTGDIISVSRKNQEPYTFRYQGKVVILCNGTPTFTDTSEGIYRRMMIFNFFNQYKDQEEIDRIKGDKSNVFLIDRTLRDKIKKEAPSILNLFVEGLLRLRDDNYKFVPSKVSSDSISRIRRDSDSAIQFLEETFVFDKDSVVSLDEVFYSYRSWYRDNVHDGSLRFRSNEMAKRIKEVFKIESCGRLKFYDAAAKTNIRRTAFHLRRIEEDENDSGNNKEEEFFNKEVEEKTFSELEDIIKDTQPKLDV